MAAVDDFHLSNLGWSWWTRPRAVKIGNEIWVGGVDSGGAIRVDVLNLSDFTIGAKRLAQFERDDHNNPAIVAVAGKVPVVFYNRHNQDGLMRQRKGSANAETGWKGLLAETTAFTLASGEVTYAVALPIASANEIHLFCRDSSRYWVYARSTDWAATWPTRRQIFDGGLGNYLYMTAVAVGTTARFAMAHHPEMAPHDVYYCEANLTTGDVTVPGDATVLGNIQTGTNMPLVYSTLQRVRTAPGVLRSWVYDVGVAADPEVVWVEFDDTNIAGTATYYYAKRVAGSWVVNPIVAAGSKFGQNNDGAYIGGVQLDGEGRVLVSRKDGSTWKIERYVTTDNGATWTPTLIASSTNKLVRAWPIEGNDGSLSVAYHEITSWFPDDDNQYGYKAFDGSVVVT